MSTESTGARTSNETSQAEVAQNVQTMFNNIAPKYDLLNHLISMGLDRRWWRKTAQAFVPVLHDPQARIVDICCGTGDQTYALLQQRAPNAERITGLDFSAQMLDRARCKYATDPIDWIEGDAMHLPFADNSLDLVTAAFGFRNLTDYAGGLREIARVLKPGGQIGILEANQPEGISAVVYNTYFRHIAPLIGGMWSGDRAAYRYLPDSVARFPRPPRMLAMLREADFRNETWDGYLLHSAGLYKATEILSRESTKTPLSTRYEEAMYDVIIAGAGPVGLFLSTELQLAGLRTLVLERAADSRSPMKTLLGGRGLNLPSTEAFYRRGLLPQVKRTSIAWFDPAATASASAAPIKLETPPTPQPQRFGGHFAAMMIDAKKLDFSDSTPYTLPGPSIGGGLVTLEGLEDVLATRARELGVEIRYDAAVTAVEEATDSVTVTSANGESFAAKYLVGCDGGRSAVRKLAGFEFVGTGPELTAFQAIAELAEPNELQPGFNLTANGVYIQGPGPGRVTAVVFDGGIADRGATITAELFQEKLRFVTGTDVVVSKLHLGSTYTDNARQATSYRRGRVLLAGDAAHVHSPFGGQGLNLGIGDAMNLGWKLALVARDIAPDSLLDTYTAERHPIGAWCLDWTRAQVALMRPERYARAMASIVRELLDTTAGATFFSRKISGLWLHYDLSDGEPQTHPLVGHSAPDFTFPDGTRLGDHLHQGKAVLLEFDGANTLASLATKWPERLTYLPAVPENALALHTIFVRPDGFVAYASNEAPDTAALSTCIARWLGPPTA